MRRSELESRVAAASNGSTVTLEMVAKEAGVSPSTVSRILNGTARVREAKVRAVEAAIAKLRFMPNPVARSLAGGKSMSVGVVIQAIDSPFYGEALAAIEKGLLRASYSALFVSGHWREGDERRAIDHLVNRRVEGIILMNSCLSARELVHVSQSIPLVLTGRHVAGDRIYSLDVDSTPGARLATEYLVGQGHRRIAFISGPSDHLDSLQRYAGYKAALAAAEDRRGEEAGRGGRLLGCRWLRGDEPAARFGGEVHRRICRERPDCLRCDARIAPQGPGGAEGRLHRRLRRPADVVVHDPSAHDRPPFHQADRRRRGRGVDRPDRGAQAGRARCPLPRSRFASRRARCGAEVGRQRVAFDEIQLGSGSSRMQGARPRRSD